MGQKINIIIYIDVKIKFVRVIPPTPNNVHPLLPRGGE